MGLLLVRLAEAMLLKLPLPLLLFDPQGKYPHHLYNKNFRMENVPLLCDLAAAIALIQEWFFFRTLLHRSFPLCPSADSFNLVSAKPCEQSPSG